MYHVSYSLNSFKGGSIGDYIGDYYKTMRVIKGHTRSLDYSSCSNHNYAAWMPSSGCVCDLKPGSGLGFRLIGVIL